MAHKEVMGAERVCVPVCTRACVFPEVQREREGVCCGVVVVAAAFQGNHRYR